MTAASEQQTDAEHFLEKARVGVSTDGDPMIRFDDGSKLRLDVHVTEWTHEKPDSGEPVEMAVEVDSDDFPWWTIYPERRRTEDADRRGHYPEVEITPRVETGTEVHSGGGSGA